MFIEQAIFTSARTERLEGYQLAGRSPGITAEVARELTNWGPAHDSLWRDEAGASSINFNPLASGLYCISRTTLAGAEYSGRSGGRVYTQMLVMSRESLERFAANPFLVVQALSAAGRMSVLDKVPAELPTLPLLGRARTSSDVHAEPPAELLSAIRSPDPILVFTDLDVESLFQAVLHKLDVAERLTLSFTTGLRPSKRRPFKLTAMPADRAVVRETQRLSGAKVVEILSRAQINSAAG